MQHPIGEHALLANSRTAALIDPDGNVAWLCWPRIDSSPLLFSILDVERGGTFAVRPARSDAVVISRRYLPRSLVLETTWQVGAARLIVEDALDLGEGPLLIRRLRAEGDDVHVAVTVTAPGWPGAPGSLRIFGDVLELEGGAGVAIHAPADWEPDGVGGRCGFRARPGMPSTVTLTTAGIAVRAPSIAATLASWHEDVPAFNDVSEQPNLDGLLATTAAVLLGLRRRDGGIVAAPTTSLPQWPRSGRTWDYRYCWLRNSSLAALAMLRLGLVDSARSLGAFIGSVVIESRTGAARAHRRQRAPGRVRNRRARRIRRRAAGQDRQWRGGAGAARRPRRGDRARHVARPDRRVAGRARGRRADPRRLAGGTLARARQRDLGDPRGAAALHAFPGDCPERSDGRRIARGSPHRLG